MISRPLGELVHRIMQQTFTFTAHEKTMFYDHVWSLCGKSRWSGISQTIKDPFLHTQTNHFHSAVSISSDSKVNKGLVSEPLCDFFFPPEEMFDFGFDLLLDG